MNKTKTNEFTFLQKTLAWSVHAFTSLGLVCGFMAILAINHMEWRNAMLWLVLCLFIDGVDGTFARLFNVTEVLPKIDGQNIDYVIDFATYAIIPAYFFYQYGLVDESWNLICTIVILLVSALYYGKKGMVSDDMYFVGFPVMWNMVVFYMVFVCKFSSFWNIIFTLFFAVLHFMPIKFVYPSQGTHFRWLTIGMTVLFFFTIGSILWVYPQRNGWLTAFAYITAAYYGMMAIYNTWVEPLKNGNYKGNI